MIFLPFFFSSYYSLLDLSIFITVYLTFFVFKNPVYFIDLENFSDTINCFFYCAKSLIVFRIIRFQDKIIYFEDDIHRQLSRLALIILAILLIGNLYIFLFIDSIISNILFYFLKKLIIHI